MLEHLPAWLGKAMSGWRAGVESIAVVRPELAPPAAMALHSPAFGDMARLPERFTAGDVQRAMQGHVLAEASVWGSYALHPQAQPA